MGRPRRFVILLGAAGAAVCRSARPLWDLYVEPATPSLPSMRGRFTTPHATSRSHTSAQVKGAAEGWSVGRREVTCSAVSGKSLARRLRGHACLVVLGTVADVIVPAALDDMLTGRLRCIADLRRRYGRVSSERRRFIRYGVSARLDRHRAGAGYVCGATWSLGAALDDLGDSESRAAWRDATVPAWPVR